MRRIYAIACLLLFVLVGSASTREVKLKLLETSDIHGNIFPYDFVRQREWGGSLARVHALAESERRVYGDNLLLMDNGDILQGQPSAYYYNFIDTASVHLTAAVLNYMRYSVANMGNHDIEAGHAAFDRWIAQCDFPVLGANIIRTSNQQTYLKPYVVIERDGVKVAVLGMITPAIPVWLPEVLWSGLYFADMEETARKWMKVIRERERPDVVVGIFHAGSEARTMSGIYREDASMEVAQRIPGFDVVMMGHDHRRFCEKVVNVEGDSVLLINPASNGRVVGDVEITIRLDDSGKRVDKRVVGRLANVDDFEPDAQFMAYFTPQFNTVRDFVSERVGTFTETVTTRPAYFGSSAFIDFIHSLQLDLTGADVSFAAPLSFDATIEKGDITIGDMFNLYRYENMLYTMRMSGAEIKGFLEESYGMWVNQMRSPDDSVLLLQKRRGGREGEMTFVNFSFNFDSAAGILYTVDVTKPKGEKITILSMADGSPFELDKMYQVALNSYRGNGGGELLTKGAGIPQEELQGRLIHSTDKDLRYYMIQYIKKKGSLSPKPLLQWKLIPENWVAPAMKRDYRALFGEDMK